jgi:hypothetical protein
MTKRIFLYLFFFLIFLLSFKGVKAFSQFNANPNYDSDILGDYFTYDNNINTYYNATCSNRTGCLIIENNGTSSINRLYIEWANVSQSFYTSDWTNVSTLYYIMFNSLAVPPNQEGLLTLEYLWNATPSANIFPQIIISDASNNSALYSIPLNTTANAWHSKKYIVPSSLSSKNYKINLIYEFDNTPTRLDIDRFSFYTYDILETRVGFSGNFTYERNRYCGSNSTNITYPNTVPSYLPSEYNNTNGYLFATGDDGYECDVFKIGNKFIARRVISKDSDNWATVNVYRDPFYFIRSAGGSNTKFLVTKLSITSAEITPIQNTTPTNYTGASFWFNGIYTNVNISQPNHTGFLDRLSNYSKQTINLAPWSNYTPPATQWQYYQGVFGGGATGYFLSSSYDFFSENLFVCTPQFMCDVANNSQYYQKANCDNINYTDCGYVGCKSDLTGCNFGYVGSYCIDNNTWAYSTLQGIQSQDSCGGICRNLTNGIECLQSDNTTIIKCLNNNGAVVSCSLLLSNQTQTALANCLSNHDYYCYSALAISGNLLGINDKSLAESFLSIVITFIISISILYVGRKSKFGMEGFLVSVFAFLTVFTLLGLFNPIIWVLIIIIDAYMLYSMVLGGKK